MSDDSRDIDREVHEANGAFYRALAGLDLGAMEALWLHDARAVCVHPGRDALFGWDAIRASWEAIFAATGWMHVEPTVVRIVVLGEVATVSCLENITAQSDEGIGVASARATNLFYRVGHGWKIVLHHASPVPVDMAPAPEGGPQ